MPLCFAVNQTPECLCQQPIGFSLCLLLVGLSYVSSCRITPPPTLPKCTTYLIYTLKQEVQQYSRHRNNSYLAKLLAWLTNANTGALGRRRNWYPILTCRIGTNELCSLVSMWHILTIDHLYTTHCQTI